MCETKQQSTLTEKLPFRFSSFPYALPPLTSHFFPLFPLSRHVPTLSFSSSTSTGLSKWSLRNALWSSNPGGWHHRDERRRGGEKNKRTEKVAGKVDSEKEAVRKLRCVKIIWKVTDSKFNAQCETEAPQVIDRWLAS